MQCYVVTVTEDNSGVWKLIGMEEVNQSNWFVVKSDRAILDSSCRPSAQNTEHHLKTAYMMNLGLSARTLFSRETPN
jgi:hypothetical protein